jgi:hypothetical protein
MFAIRITLPKSIGEACRSENTSVVVITLMASGKAQLWRIVNASPDNLCRPKVGNAKPFLRCKGVCRAKG